MASVYMQIAHSLMSYIPEAQTQPQPPHTKWFLLDGLGVLVFRKNSVSLYNDYIDSDGYIRNVSTPYKLHSCSETACLFRHKNIIICIDTTMTYCCIKYAKQAYSFFNFNSRPDYTKILHVQSGTVTQPPCVVGTRKPLGNHPTKNTYILKSEYTKEIVRCNRICVIPSVRIENFEMNSFGDKWDDIVYFCTYSNALISRKSSGSIRHVHFPKDIQLERECCVCYGDTELLVFGCRHVCCKGCFKALTDAACPICRKHIDTELVREHAEPVHRVRCAHAHARARARSHSPAPAPAPASTSSI